MVICNEVFLKMTFNLIGIGLNAKSLTLESLEAIKKSKKIYLDNYTIDFPYDTKKLEKVVSKKIEKLSREKIESEEILKIAKKENVSLLIYGDSLSATTHIHLISICKKNKIPYKIFHSSSILTAVAETGLEIYKFGKTTSLPTWKDNWKPDSFIEIIKKNLSIKAHTLLLVDIGLELKKTKKQLQESLTKNNLALNKIILCSNLGNKNQKIIYNTLENLPEKITKPYCLIIPSELHFLEKEFLEKI